MSRWLNPVIPVFVIVFVAAQFVRPRCRESTRCCIQKHGFHPTYDWTVNAIGPFELTEYLGLVMTWTALGLTAPFFAERQSC